VGAFLKLTLSLEHGCGKSQAGFFIAFPAIRLVQEFKYIHGGFKLCH
jgi:hypothetical protein